MAWAQLDPKAQPFLDAYTAYFTEVKLPQLDSGKLETVDMTMCMILYDLPNIPAPDEEICTRTAADFTHRRMMIDMSGEFGSKMVYRNRQLRILDAYSEEPRLMSGAQAKLVDTQLQQLFKQVQNEQLFKQFKFRTSKYVGAVRYGKVIQGEQISVTMTGPFFNTPGVGINPTTQLVFSDEKKMIGMVINTPQGATLSVLTDPEAKLPQARFIDATTYRLEGNKPVRQSKVRLSRYRLNSPLEEKLFTLTPQR